MALFLVQDGDRPLYVVAKDFGDAVADWRKVIAEENNLEVTDITGDQDAVGVTKLCDNDELVIAGKIAKAEQSDRVTTVTDYGEQGEEESPTSQPQ